MRIVFAGTPEFAVPALDALHAAPHDIIGVFSQPDRPSGRGLKVQRTPVAARADALGLTLHQPLKLDVEAQSLLRKLQPEVMVVVAYGLILPASVLQIPKYGCINIHASLLPRWRGAAPIARAIEAGDSVTGITIMRMDAGLDTGPMLLHEALPIDEHTTTAQLHDRLSALGGALIVEALARLTQGQLSEQAQPAEGATYARKLSKEEARIDWTRSAVELARRIRAFNPAPVAWTELEGERIRLWNARALKLPTAAAPGTVLAADANGIHVASGDGVVVITEIQRPGGKALPAQALAANWKLQGRRFA